MIVYMLWNVVTEKAYIGQTEKSLAERWRAHKEDVKHGSHNRLHDAMREWRDDAWWEMAVLQVCYDRESLNAVEDALVVAYETRNPAIGYNDDPGGNRSLTSNAARARHTMSEEEREQYREYGRRGARPKAEMSDVDRERYREWGRKGAERARLKRATLPAP